MQSTKHQVPNAKIPVCIEAPVSFLPKAQYAVAMALLPLPVAPVWVTREALGPGGLYYGPHPEAISPDVLRLPLCDSTIRYFEERRAYPVDAVRWQEWEGERWPVLFPFGKEKTPDWIASTFFWLSGWQERVNPVRDRHGRFPFAASLQARWELVERPVVEVYRRWISSALEEKTGPFPRRDFDGAAWALCPTHDIDYLRKWTPGLLWRETVDYLLRNQTGKALRQRLGRLRSAAVDALTPGDAYRESWRRIAEVERQARATATYFVKAGVTASYDAAYNTRSRFFRDTLHALRADGHEIGLHPSYQAQNHLGRMHTEKATLEALLGQPLRSVRQHYLRYDVPRTPRLHAQLGFQLDSSLAFADREGFRHATCLPFRLFDADANRPLDVWEMPLAVMDTTLFRYRRLDSEAALRQSGRMLEAARRFGGLAVFLWHNILYDALDFPAWHRHFEQTLHIAASENARMCSLKDAFEGFLK